MAPRRRAAALLWLVWLASAVAPPAAAGEDPGIGQLFRLINQARITAGVVPLVTDGRLMRSAQAHSADMARNDFFGHRGADGASFTDRMARAGYDYRLAAENVAAGQDSAADVLRTWMRSKAHRDNLLNGEMREIGIGHVFAPDDEGRLRYRHYWTVKLGRRGG
jgi:uncharacterized protein YkwD